MTSQQFLVCDNSSAANYKSWASALSNIIRTFGWTNSGDSGQLNGAGGGNWAGVSTVPGSGLFYYEIFQPGDGLTNYFLKVEYGNSVGSANSPTVRLTASTGTDGAGTCNGFVTTATRLAGSAITPPSTTTTYECDFCGDSGKLSILLWRNAPDTNNAAQCFAVQRSLDATGAPTGTYVTIWTGGENAGNGAGFSGFQQSLYFGVGPAPVLPNHTQTGAAHGWSVLCVTPTFTGSSAFNGGIPMANAQPYVGKFDYACTVVGVAYAPDIVEGVPFTITNQYGQTKTYIPTKSSVMQFCTYAPLQGSQAVCMEFD